MDASASHEASIDHPVRDPATDIDLERRLSVQRRLPIRTTALYLLFGFIWIVGTDRLLAMMGLDANGILFWQTIKGWFFIGCSGAFLYWLLLRHRERSELLNAALQRSENEIRDMNAQLERRVLERTRQLEAANRELEAFANAVSHDLRAPLRAVAGFTEMLREHAGGALDERGQHFAQRIRDNTQHMAALIDDLLSLSRISRSELHPRELNLTELLLELGGTMRERYAPRTVALDVQEGLRVQADPGLLRIAMENLLDNAWKYTGQTSDARIVVRCEQRGGDQVFSLSDNGVGFDMAHVGELFRPFQRLHSASDFPGTGIGLVTVQRILERHGGRVWVTSVPCQGTTFYFTLSV